MFDIKYVLREFKLSEIATFIERLGTFFQIPFRLHALYNSVAIKSIINGNSMFIALTGHCIQSTLLPWGRKNIINYGLLRGAAIHCSPE